MRDIQHSLRLRRVTDLQDRHIRNRPHHGQVFDGLVGDPARRHHTGQESHQPDLQSGVRNRHLKLVEGPAVEENRERVQPWLKALAGKACGKTHHVLLGHPHREKAIWVGVSPDSYFT